MSNDGYIYDALIRQPIILARVRRPWRQSHMASGRHWRNSLSMVVGLLPAMFVFMVGYASSQPVQAAQADFNGTWSAQWCDKKNPQPECGKFDLLLIQKGDRICGQHFVATPGLARLDEGDPGSILGTFDGKKATFVIDNTRNGSKYLATAELTRAGLNWHLVGMVMAGEGSEPAIIPVRKVLKRNSGASFAAQLQELKAAPCRWPDETAEQ